MGKLKIHAGDFAKGRAWFHPGTGFVLQNKNGKRESIPIEDLVVEDEATEGSIRALGGDEAMIGELERVAPSDRTKGQRLFIASFDDGRLLLASARLRSYTEICVACRPVRATHPPEPMRIPRSGEPRRYRPKEDQEELAEYARDLEARRTGVYHATPEELEAIDEGLRASAEGRIATEEEVEAAFRKFRQA
jgi:hypothetical protein